MHVEGAGWGIPTWGILSQLCNHVGKYPGLGDASVLMSSPIHMDGYIPPMQKSLTPDSSDITGAICKVQRSNSGEHARIVTLFIHFLTCIYYSRLLYEVDVYHKQLFHKCFSIASIS
jgi:hypothetical protein